MKTEQEIKNHIDWILKEHKQEKTKLTISDIAFLHALQFVLGYEYPEKIIYHKYKHFRDKIQLI